MMMLVCRPRRQGRRVGKGGWAKRNLETAQKLGGPSLEQRAGQGPAGRGPTAASVSTQVRGGLIQLGAGVRVKVPARLL